MELEHKAKWAFGLEESGRVRFRDRVKDLFACFDRELCDVGKGGGDRLGWYFAFNVHVNYLYFLVRVFSSVDSRMVWAPPPQRLLNAGLCDPKKKFILWCLCSLSYFANQSPPTTSRDLISRSYTCVPLCISGFAFVVSVQRADSYAGFAHPGFRLCFLVL